MPPPAKRAAAPHSDATKRAETKEASLDNNEGVLHISQANPENSQGQLEIRGESFGGTSFFSLGEWLVRTFAGSCEAQGYQSNSGTGCHEVSPGPLETSEYEVEASPESFGYKSLVRFGEELAQTCAEPLEVQGNPSDNRSGCRKVSGDPREASQVQL